MLDDELLEKLVVETMKVVDRIEQTVTAPYTKEQRDLAEPGFQVDNHRGTLAQARELYGTVDRHENILIKGQDRFGKPTRIKASGWLARVFQHEMDHLDGQLYIDIAKEIWKAKDEDQEDDEPLPE